jgi:hypothetical protein
MTDPNLCSSGDLHAFTVEEAELRCADCLLTHEDWRARGGSEAKYDVTVLERWSADLASLEES